QGRHSPAGGRRLSNVQPPAPGGAASDLGNQRGRRRRFECGALLSGLPLGGLGAA
ncbi:unnamed protein product, partial [Effrenium voratum]